MIKKRLEALEQQKTKFDWVAGDTGYRKDGKVIPCPYQIDINKLEIAGKILERRRESYQKN